MPGSGGTTQFRIGEWLFEPQLNRLSRDDRQVELEPLASRLLEHMASRPEYVFSADELVDAVWDGRIVSDNPIYKLVATLRRSLDDDTTQPQYIETIRKRGYRLIAPVTVIESELSAPATEPESTRFKPSWIAAAGLVLAAVLWVLTQVPQDGVDAVSAEPPVIAVLPFEDMSEDGDQSYLGRGIAEEIIHALTEQRRYGVVGRTSSFAVASQTGDIRRIGDLLGANYVVEGSVRKDGDALRITAQLIEADSGLHAWSGNFDRPFEEILDVQSDIARMVLFSVADSIDADPVASLPRTAQTDRMDAYRAYLVGRNWLSQRGSVAAAEAEKAFLDALSMDNDLVQAMEGLVEAQFVLNFHGVKSSNEAYELAEVYAERAFALSPNRAEVHAALGRLAELGGRQGEAEQAYRTALEFDPRNIESLGALAWLLHTQLRFEEAVAVFDRALAVEPASPLLSVAAGMNTEYTGDYACAGKLYQRAVDIAPGMMNTQFGIGAYLWRAHGDLENAAMRMQRAVEIDTTGAIPPAMLALIYLDAGDPEAASEWLVKPGERGYQAYWTALARLAYGVYTDATESASSAASLIASYGPDPVALRYLRDQAIASGAPYRAIALYPDALRGESIEVTQTNIRMVADLAYAYEMAGESDRARELATRVLAVADRVPRKAWFGTWLSDIVAENIVNGPEAALERLQEALAGGWRILGWWELEKNPALDAVRALPGYSDVAASLQRSPSTPLLNESRPGRNLGFCDRLQADSGL
ncbi:MAG: winged helix-turn-helix domain-containing protein [Pseudomonadota bacterium]